MEQSFLNPAKLIESLPIEEGMKIAEFGSGTGIFSIALSQKIGRDGKVYAVDVQKETLEALRGRARMEGLFNIETVWADLERPGATKIPDAVVDITMIPNMLFQCQKKLAVLQEAHRITKPAGTVVIIDWIPEKAIHGKAMGWPVAQEEMQRTAEQAGLTFVSVLQTGSVFHYGLLFRK